MNEIHCPKCMSADHRDVTVTASGVKFMTAKQCKECHAVYCEDVLTNTLSASPPEIDVVSDGE